MDIKAKIRNKLRRSFYNPKRKSKSDSLFDMSELDDMEKLLNGLIRELKRK